MSDGERHSIAAQPSLITDPIEEAKRESENAVPQFDRVLDLIDDVARGGRPFRLRTSMISICTASRWTVCRVMRVISGRLTFRLAKANTSHRLPISSPGLSTRCVTMSWTISKVRKRFIYAPMSCGD
jgi:hypothetical protein